MKPSKILLAKPRGFCAGVDRAIEVVDLALSLYPGPVYVRKQIVHNKHVIDSFVAKGVVFVEEVDEIPDAAVAIFSAHGVSPEVRAQAARKRLTVIDATCPLVTKVHLEAIRFAREGRSIILVGHKGHEEVIGTMGEVPAGAQLVGTVEEAEKVEVADPDRVAVVTQTTLGVDDANVIIDALRRRFPSLVTPSSDDICYATQNRQTAIKALAQRADLVLVVGSDNSSNSKRLKEVAESFGARAYLIDDASEIDPSWLEGVQCVALTAGASAPEHLVQQALDYFKAMGVTEVEEVEAIEEQITFAPPPELARALAERTSRTS
ncbi:MAG: 4-hydroxy-3-methylbut-2-enyl diphosphate reductase [Acidobacteria bacterium]|nr:MAG: 4-hydroxy-3-methylbut-2-enyl diphosphate reductase [Acidobacteriota bacterium]